MPFLARKNQEIRETAAVALGILANPKSIDTLSNLLLDNEDGRRLVGREVDYRTRAFAAYGLSLIGARTADEGDRHRIVERLVEALHSDRSSLRDVRVACLVSLGLVPLNEIRSSADGEEAPAASRVGQLEFVFDYLVDEEQPALVRAHAPTALVRLMQGLPAEDFEAYKTRVAPELIRRLDKKSREDAYVVQSCALALGQIGDRDSDELDVEIREALIEAGEDARDQQARAFALVALAQAGGAQGQSAPPARDDVARHLGRQLADSSSFKEPWVGLAIGVFGNARNRADGGHPTDLGEALRMALAAERNATRVGPYAIGIGLLEDHDAQEVLLEKLRSVNSPEARGYVCVALGLLSSRAAIEPIQDIIVQSKYQPDLLRQAAVALGLIGDSHTVPDLIAMLESAKGLSSQAALASALGTIGDERSVTPLVAMLENRDVSAKARGFAAVALGIVADKEPLPWNSKISVDLNYWAATRTLNDPSGTGILNIL